MATTTTGDNGSGMYGGTDAARAMQRAGDTVVGGMAPAADPMNDRAADPMNDRATDRLHDAAGRTTENARATVDRAAGYAGDALSRTTDAGSDAGRRMSATGGQLVDDARDLITAHPLRALGLAAAAGFVVARILR